ncbi:hypothetical protein D3C72_1604090 [compost metagenome]
MYIGLAKILPAGKAVAGAGGVQLQKLPLLVGWQPAQHGGGAHKKADACAGKGHGGARVVAGLQFVEVEAPPARAQQVGQLLAHAGVVQVGAQAKFVQRHGAQRCGQAIGGFGHVAVGKAALDGMKGYGVRQRQGPVVFRRQLVGFLQAAAAWCAAAKLAAEGLDALPHQPHGHDQKRELDHGVVTFAAGTGLPACCKA